MMLLLVFFLVAIIIEGSVGLPQRPDEGSVRCDMSNYHVGEGATTIATVRAGETLTLECRKGYYFSRSLQDVDYSDGVKDFVYDRAPRVLTCLYTGRWDKPIPTCHAFTCPRPNIPARGAIRPYGQTTFKANESITYVCGEGTVLVGYSSQTCDMMWNGWSYGLSPPSCITVRCPGPEGPRNGWITNRNRDVGSTIHYYCNRGYERYGAPNQTCQANGKWSEGTPICKKERQIGVCDNPVVPPGSNARGDSTLNGAKVTHRCFRPEFLKGPSERICGPLGWSPSSEPECEALHAFDHRDTLAETFFSIVDRFSSVVNGDVINGMFDRRYDLFFLIDSSHSVPPDHFALAKEFVYNVIDELTLTNTNTAIGLASFSTKPEEEFTRSGGVHADTGRGKPSLHRRLEDLKRIDRDTNITGALEFARKVMIPLSSHARRGEDAPKVIFLFSDGDVTLGGNPTSSAKKLKYLGVEIFTIKIGTMMNKKTRSILEGVSSEADFPRHYPHVLRIKDKLDLEYMVANYKSYSTAGTLFPRFPTCGVAGDIHYTKSYQVGGDAANSTTWPWVMAISKIRLSADNSINKAVFACTGTLISEQWVLTTAKCIDDRNDTNFVVTSASSPNTFDGEMVRETFRYGNMPGDIALLRLLRPLKFGPYVRPICLPNHRPSELDDKFGDYAVTIGWDRTEEKPKLIQAAVPIVEDRKCRARSRVVGYCAGLNTVLNGTCSKDIGSPLMIKSRMDKMTREVHWIQIGVAWQTDGCTATKGNSGRFARLEPFMPWINSIMN
ncbi:complement factor B-like [Lineus longissimus]|uniref:complement factor B-like n=1 Tax=Lineus longissimus TaxID=88925 RepID=UPI002B4E48A2